MVESIYLYSLYAQPQLDSLPHFFSLYRTICAKSMSICRPLNSWLASVDELENEEIKERQ